MVTLTVQYDFSSSRPCTSYRVSRELAENVLRELLREVADGTITSVGYRPDDDDTAPFTIRGH